ncbi:MAG: hypothetical protein OER88_05790 [Planctomycetota bacterium]|nr:hypothetical protein [Planctomycetota bacterium]
MDVETLTPRETLRDSKRREVLLVVDPRGERFVLKRYRDRRGAAQERAFLRSARTRPFRHLRVPRLVQEGDDFVVVEYVDREHATDRAGLARVWSPSDVRLWIDALLEFQGTWLPPHLFSRRQRFLGALYPVWRTAHLWMRFRSRLPKRLGALLPRILGAYVRVRPRFEGVQTHYDLDGSNYAFCRASRAMSMLDFELPYYRGDPLFDVIYQLTLCARPYEDWTVQSVLLSEYVRRAARHGHRMVGLVPRIRLIALQCTLGCLCYHHAAADLRVHARNLELLLDARRFRRWLAGALRR